MKARRVLFFLPIIAIAIWLTYLPIEALPGKPPVSIGLEDDPNAQAAMEFLMLRDPRTNAIPMNMPTRERRFAEFLPVRTDAAVYKGQSGALVWTERGPDNVGGRTRVFAVDVASPNTLIAGSVAGGIWKSTDDGASWSLTTAPAQIHSTTCIAQDTRTGRTNTWYVGTGELRGSTNNDTRFGSLYRGDGIFKSTDGGSSWALLPSTSSGTPNVTDPFDYIWSVAVNPASAQDEVYAATYKGIYRSSDGGGSWTVVLTADSSFTDVAVTSTGVAYAFTKNNNAPRIWRSPDGVTWTNITPATFPAGSGRIIIGIAPSTPTLVYFFIDGANLTPPIQLWKYKYVSGDGSGTGGVWVNRGNSMPGGINTQGGYDMVLHVSPVDTDFVLIGGTNLYRSLNGFASSGATTTIGGYPYWPGGNHHPDLHSGAFKPGNPGVYYSSHDGGISRTDDIYGSTIFWNSLNNGYNVTQFYSVSLDPDSGSNMIMAGAQDNGTQLGNAPGVSSWEMVFGGDGTIIEVAPGTDDRLYTQYQGGQMQRQTRLYTDLFDITPSAAINQLFVNPILLDPGNSSILYYGGGSTSPSLASAVWRNDDSPNATQANGWSVLPATDVGAVSGWTRRISTFGLSATNSANVLYYGTTDGIVKRVDNANTGVPTVSTITPPGLNGGTATGGFVRSIAVDPTNSDHALVAFGNYNFQSIWYTTNGGTSWTDVEGNLSGSSGPSVRWVTTFYIDNVQHVFLGTSIGVLSTTLLNGSSTVWTQEAATTIGNVIIAMLDYRPSDRTLAVGTHARGVFTTQFDSPLGVGENDELPAAISLKQNYPNPFNPTTVIPYTLARSEDVRLTVHDALGREMRTLVNAREGAGEHRVEFDARGLASGIYFYTLRASGRVETKKLTLLR